MNWYYRGCLLKKTVILLKRYSQKLHVLIPERKASSSTQSLKNWEICATLYTQLFNKALRQGERRSAKPRAAAGAFPAARCLSQALPAVSREHRAAARALSRQRRRAGDSTANCGALPGRQGRLGTLQSISSGEGSLGLHTRHAELARSRDPNAIPLFPSGAVTPFVPRHEPDPGMRLSSGGIKNRQKGLRARKNTQQVNVFR